MDLIVWVCLFDKAWTHSKQYSSSQLRLASRKESGTVCEDFKAGLDKGFFTLHVADETTHFAVQAVRRGPMGTGATAAGVMGAAAEINALSCMRVFISMRMFASKVTCAGLRSNFCILCSSLRVSSFNFILGLSADFSKSDTVITCSVISFM